jgi:DNA-binding NarL/FixJ family response regulator
MSSFRILVVEDHEPFRKYICMTLARRSEFLIVGEVSDGREAVRKAEELQPDVILLDIGLPGMNGLEVTRRVRKSCPNSKILFMSQISDPDVVQEAIRLGALGYVEKKRLGVDLLDALEAVCQNRQFVSCGLLGAEKSGPTHLIPGANPRPRRSDPRFSTAATHLTHRHEVQFYADDATLLESLAPFVADSLKAGNRTLVIATEPHREAILHYLQGKQLDWPEVMRQGLYTSLDAAKSLAAFMDVSGPDRTRFWSLFSPLVFPPQAAAQNAQKVVAFGEMVALLCAEGRSGEALQLERMWNELLTNHSFMLRCAYPLTGDLDPELYAQICEEHDAVLAPSSCS